jgi:type VI secretion system VgrG family protein
MGDVRADTAQYSFKVAGQVFQVLSFSGHEEVFGLSSYHLTLWLDNSAVDIKSLVRKDAEITIRWGTKEKKYFGIVAHFSQLDAHLPGLGGTDTEHGVYGVEVVPTLWLLGRHRHCRIFQRKSADIIIKQVLDERGMAGKYDPKMGSYPKREYCVQYRETDLAFICRLMQEEGIFFYFTHDGKEMMVLGDQAAHFGTCAPDSEVKYKSESGGLSTDEEYLSGLTYEESAYTGKVKYKDFDYRDPTKPLKVEQTAADNTDLEIYDYNVERYLDDGRGRTLAKVSVDSEAAMQKVLAGSGDWRSASAGCVMTLSGAYRGDLNGEWVLLSVDHTATQEAGTGVQHSVSLTGVRKDPLYRPAQTIPKPFINLQTAKVVGPSGEKIYMDDQGRAKVQFHWDPDGKENEDSSCWIRVAAFYAGMDQNTHKKHGSEFHPLIGDEVVVDFLDGDPDNPLIVGAVYNGDNQPIVKKTELVRNRILTPYQHQLLLDDKNANITLNTGGSEYLSMTDKKADPAEGKVNLGTCGNEFVWLEDNEDTLGNLIVLCTADAHSMQFASKDDYNGIAISTHNHHHIGLSDAKNRIIINTQNGNVMVLDDPNKGIEIKTTDGHTILMSDKDQKILIKSKGGHSIEMSDSGPYLQLTDGSGNSSIQLNSDGITLNTTGTIICVAHQDITLSASQDMNISADQATYLESGDDLSISSGTAMSIESGSTLEIGSTDDTTVTAGTSCTVSAVGGSLDLTGSTSADLTGGASVSISAGGTMSTSCTTMTASAAALYTITAAMVKIN